MKKKILLIVLFSTTITSFCQEIEALKLDQYFTALETNNKFMGSVAIYKNNSIVYNKQFGFSSISKQIKPDINTKYRIGSISKTFTAVLVFKAIEQGKLQLKDTIDRYFPTIKNAHEITISDLLNHRSGIHSFTDNRENYLSYHQQAKNQKEMVQLISEYKSDFKPNSTASYSNSNYLLLSYILEKVYDKTFEALLNDEICIPFKLKNTYYKTYLLDNNNESYSYTFNKRKWEEAPQTNGVIGLGAASIVSTPTELIKFSELLFNGAIITHENLMKMMTIQDNYGMGLFKTDYFKTTSFGHNGGIDGFVSMFRYFPDSNMAIAVTANGLDYNFNTIETVLVKSVFNKHFDIPIFNTYAHSVRELNLYLGTYSSNSFPVTIDVVKSKKQLILKVFGEQPMEFEGFEKGKFKFDKGGLIIEFFPSKNEMLITQGGQTNILNRK